MKKDIYSGLYAGLLSTIICNPLDVIRTHKQLNKEYILSVRFLYRGIKSSIIGIPLFWSIYFPSYNYLKNNNYSILSGYLACNLASTVTCPIWFIRQRYQVKGNFEVIKFYKNNGIKPFYNAIIPTYLINISFLFQIPIYEFLKTKYENNTTNIFFITVLSKTISTFITYPIDTIRTFKRNNDKLSIKSIINILNKNKIMYYSGFFVYLSRGLPSHTITFCTYEYFNKK